MNSIMETNELLTVTKAEYVQGSRSSGSMSRYKEIKARNTNQKRRGAKAENQILIEYEEYDNKLLYRCAPLLASIYP